jgi:hypothetical protein
MTMRLLGFARVSGVLALFAVPLLPSTAPAQIPLVGASDAEWTVLTMAPNGAWGTGTADTVGKAIAAAISACRRNTRELGCGAYQLNIRSGFALGLRCGSENILAAGASLDEARIAALTREYVLRRDYHPDMGSCRQVVMVAPDGTATAAPQMVTSSGGGGRESR